MSKSKAQEEEEKLIVFQLMNGTYFSEIKSPSFKLYFENFINGTVNWSAAEVGSYFLLLCKQFDKFGLINDPEELSEIARSEPNLMTKILKKFELCDDGKLRNRRLEKERAAQIVYSKHKSAIGKLGAEARYGKTPETKQIQAPKTETMTGDFFYIGTETFKFAVSKYIKNEMQIFLDGWQMKNTSLKAETVLAQMDKEKVGHQYTDERHIQNAFNKTAKDMVKEATQTNTGYKKNNQAEQVIKASVPKRVDTSK